MPPYSARHSAPRPPAPRPPAPRPPAPVSPAPHPPAGTPAARRASQLGCLLLAGATVGLATSAPASAVTGHEPFGYLDRVAATTSTTIIVQGWTADPDNLRQPLSVRVTVDGKQAVKVVTSIARPDVASARGTGPTTGFSVNVTARAGSHAVCAIATNLAAGADTTLGCRTVVLPASTPAPVPAATAVQLAHSPFGALDHATVSGSTITLTGWAADPDNVVQPLKLGVSVDGKRVTITKGAVLTRTDVARVHKTGPNQGYRLSVTAGNGLHTVCTIAANLGVGVNRQLGCASVRVGPPPLTAAQIAAHSPSGALETATAIGTSTLRVTGWASDPDSRVTSIKVSAYLDGAVASTAVAGIARPDLVASQKVGPRAGYSLTLNARSGSHNVCLWALNIQVGANKFLGCSALSTPAVAMPSGPTPATPAVNKKVTALAAKYVGSRYVWGGASPSTGFDCSGLVQYTYRVGAGISTPRVAQDQFSSARMIAMGRAAPGDLVFFHDNLGYVYHVGIYAGAGRMYAAVDEAEGVRFQTIWDSTATYGSFTHG